MKTFKELYNFLKKFGDDIEDWLNEPWKGKDKQESLLRLFSSLQLISKLNGYHICKGNFNLRTIKKIKSKKDIFYKDDKLISLKDKGDSSDLTGISKINKKEILVTTSKNLNKNNVGKLDIDKILTNFRQYQDDGYVLKLCIVIRNKNDYEKMYDNIEKTNKKLKDQMKNIILIDWNDLIESFHIFKKIYEDVKFKDLLKIKYEPLCLKMHQELGVKKTIDMKNNKVDKILWGHIQRSGKSYIIAGSIIDDSKNKDKCNYFVITTAPNETIQQQSKVFNCSQLEDFNIIILDGKNKKPKIKDKNIILCSKQFLQTKINKTKNILWLKKMIFEMRFIDESHNGGTTELAKKTLDYYGKNTFTVQITATYSKPINDYNIPKENWILWDLEDIQLCKDIHSKENLNKLINKHGAEMKKIISKYSVDNIVYEYEKYPDLHILTDKINDKTKNIILERSKDNDYGWSTESCFLLKQRVKDNNIMYIDKFQNEKENLKLWYKIFGKYDDYGIADKKYSDKIVFMERIKNICKNANINSRFIGEGYYEKNPMIIMVFLPQNNIDMISRATKTLLEKNDVVPNYNIISINSKTTNDPKNLIEDERVKAKSENKNGVIVLSGRQCSLGVSINDCDIVILLNDSMSFDMIYQMMFRCMTEGKNKKCGFVIDLNIQRVIETSIINYASIVKPNYHPKESSKYILNEKLINLNIDHWSPSFGNSIKKIEKLTENIYDIYSSNTERALRQFLNRLKFKDIKLSIDDQISINNIFKINISSKNKKKKNILNDDNIKKGIEKKKIEIEDSLDKKDKLNDENNENNKINYMDILKHVIPLICLLTIHNEDTSFIKMFKYIENNKYINDILLNQIKSWWGKKIEIGSIESIINIYKKYMDDDKETKQIIRTVKELFIKSKRKPKELSKLIDKYLIPQELEKKTNAEVSTPHKLRQEMLDKMPDKFWISKQKVFEPCSGKGGFLIDIVDRFMEGLKDKYKNEKKRYKIIVEKCLYFSDINPTNIFVCKMLLDPNDEYKLNYNEGNTLELDIEDKWCLDGFDAVIGNPPYNSSGNTGTGNTVWQHFVKQSLENWLLKDGYLLYVHPPSWRKPCYNKSQLNGLFQLMTHNNIMKFLSIHNISDGKKTFNCGTKYDWYLIKHKKNKKEKTLISDENNVNYEIILNTIDWLPNSNIDNILKIISSNFDDNIQVLMNSSYHATRKYVKNQKDEVFKYPLIHSTPAKGIRYKYSSTNDKGHFGISKVIFGEAGINHVVIDIDGSYGMTQGAMAILINNKEDGKNIKKAVMSDKFKKILNSCMWGNFRIDWKLFTYFKKDFWKAF
jgi:hypothetical protein